MILTSSNLAINWAGPINWEHPLNRCLVAWWLCVPGVGGSRWLDLCGRHHGTLTNMDPATDWIGPGPQWVGTGNMGALDFDGSNDYVDVPNMPDNLFAGDFTVFIRMYPASASTNLFLFDKRAGASDGLMCYQNGTVWDNRMDGSGVAAISNSIRLGSIGGWHSLGCSRRAGSVVTYAHNFFDGRQTNSGTNSADLSNTTALRIGARSFTSPTGYWPGRIAEIRVLSCGWLASDFDDYTRLSQQQYPGLLNRLRPWWMGVEAAPGGGLSIPIAAYHYRHHLTA